MKLSEQEKQKLLLEFRERFAHLVSSEEQKRNREYAQIQWDEHEALESFLLEKVAEAKEETAREIFKQINTRRQPTVLESGHVHVVIFGVDLNEIEAKYVKREIREQVAEKGKE